MAPSIGEVFYGIARGMCESGGGFSLQGDNEELYGQRVALLVREVFKTSAESAQEEVPHNYRGVELTGDNGRDEHYNLSVDVGCRCGKFLCDKSISTMGICANTRACRCALWQGSVSGFGSQTLHGSKNAIARIDTYQLREEEGQKLSLGDDDECGSERGSNYRAYEWTVDREDGRSRHLSDGRDSGSVGFTGVLNTAVVEGVLKEESKRDRNRRNRQEKKERKKKRQMMSVDWRKSKIAGGGLKVTSGGKVGGVKSGATKDEVASSAGGACPLRASLESKWIAENELAILKAKRQHAILSANDVDADVRKYRTAVCVATERNMVAIEKAHEKLKATGNSTIDDDDRVHTIIGDSTPSLSSGSISPNSSASLSEFRQLAKAKADVEEKNERLEKALESLGLSLEAVEKRSKSVWTDNDHNHEILAQLCPDGYGMDRDFCEEGKFRVC